MRGILCYNSNRTKRALSGREGVRESGSVTSHAPGRSQPHAETYWCRARKINLRPRGRAARVARGTGMPFTEALKLALGSILSHKLRSFLTLLGVIFGVATVIVVVSLVEGFNSYVDEKIANI